MTTENLIAAVDFCRFQQIEYNFISSLSEAGLVTVVTVNEDTFIPAGELPNLEKMIHLHNDLEINIAGIEAISHMLSRIELMQEEMTGLRNRLRIYGE